MIPSNFIPGGSGRPMRPVHYTDGTPSREVEDDWEMSGSEEMRELQEKCKKKTPINILDLRDELNNVVDLLNVCATSLMSKSEERNCISVSNILVIQVISKIKEIEQELARL